VRQATGSPVKEVVDSRDGVDFWRANSTSTDPSERPPAVKLAVLGQDQGAVSPNYLFLTGFTNSKQVLAALRKQRGLKFQPIERDPPREGVLEAWTMRGAHDGRDKVVTFVELSFSRSPAKFMGRDVVIDIFIFSCKRNAIPAR
jgi:hypothetical protein